ncbi:MAG: selenocysteine-specific translation elongation factor [Defluviitaleaceae bacterium]|nr:selenocysteine-specific translation elongation factor [Defluviitaleaceae bacterium]
MKHILIGTAGHVDHGKTALIRALTGIDADRLQEEKSRGITIDLGFAHMNLPNGDVASIVDVPGHEKFIKNMLAGAGGMDLVLLVIAADDGVMPQTREHLGILQLLNVQDGIIVLTKSDLVDTEWQDMIWEDVKNTVVDTFLRDAPIISVSSHTGQGIPELMQCIDEKIKKATAKNTTIPFRIPIDRVFSAEGFGTVVTGTLTEGTIKVGDSTDIYPEGIQGRVRNLQVHGSQVETVYAGQRVAVNLSGVKRDDILRGHVLARPDSLHPTRMLDVKLSIIKDCSKEIASGTRLHFHNGTQSILCKLVLMETDKLTAGQSAYAQLRFGEEVAVKAGDNFVVRFYSPMETVGGGVVLNTAPKKHRKSQSSEAVKALEALEKGDAGTQIHQEITNQGGIMLLEELKKRMSASTQEIDSLAEQGRIIKIGTYVITDSHRENLGSRITTLLKSYHHENPLHQGVGMAELRSQILPGKKTAFFEELLSLYNFKIQDGRVALQDFEITYTKEQKTARDAILSSLSQGSFSPPTINEDKQVLEALLAEGTIISTEPGIIFSAETIEKAKVCFSSLANQHGGSVTLAQFRDEVQTSRKFALSLLEYFDRVGFTRKVGEGREILS